MVRNQPQDLFPGLWVNLRGLVDNKALFVHRMVRDELTAKDDAAAAWVKAITLDLLIELDNQQAAFINQMSNDHTHLRYLYQQPDYAKKADPYLIATSKLRGYCVVTDEGPRDWHIPNICDRYQVPSLKLFDFMRKMNWRF